MATTLNRHQISLKHSQFLNNHQIQQKIQSNPFSPFKFQPKPKFTQLKCIHSKPITRFLLKPFLKPSLNPTTQENPTTNTFSHCKPLFFGVEWLRTLGATKRGDFRAWSRRRPGSKSSGKKNRLIVALQCTGCSGNRYTTEKRRVAKAETRKDASEKKKEDKKAKLGEGLMLSKYCPNCRKHFVHKEVKIGPSK